MPITLTVPAPTVMTGADNSSGVLLMIHLLGFDAFVAALVFGGITLDGCVDAVLQFGHERVLIFDAVDQTPTRMV